MGEFAHHALSFVYMTISHIDLSRYLVPASLLYLGLPCIIFFGGYLLWYWGIIFCACLCAGLWYAIRNRPALSPGFSLQSILLLSLIIFILLLLSGTGGYGFQDDDWLKHNAILKDLITSPWPLSYTFFSQTAGDSLSVPLVYYIAYYLPAALVGKLAGWFWANQVLFLWTWAGLTLGVSWAMLLCPRPLLPAVIIFLLFSGLDCVGLTFLRSLFGLPIGISGWEHIEMWAGNWVYSAHTALVFWVPNQAICGWIISGLFCYPMLSSRSFSGLKKHLFLYISLTCLWTPFVTLGLLPCCLTLLWLHGKEGFRSSWNDFFSFSNLVGILNLGLFALFYSAKFAHLPLPYPAIKKGIIFFVPQVTGLFWYETLALLLMFWFLEAGIYTISIVRPVFRSFALPARALFVFTTGFLALLPFFRYGQWNDLVMRASIPSFFLLAILIIRTIYHTSTTKMTIAILLIALFFGSVTPLVEFRRHLQKIAHAGVLFRLPEPSPLPKIQRASNPAFFLQYVGSADAVFFRVFARNLHHQRFPLQEGS